MIDAVYGSIDSCQATLAQGCIYTFQPDALSSSDRVRDCASLMQRVSCDDIYNRELPVACRVAPGKRSDGAHCHVGGQCASSRCAWDGSDLAGFGVCREFAQAGEACSVQDDCPPSQVCDKTFHCSLRHHPTHTLSCAQRACSRPAPR